MKLQFRNQLINGLQNLTVSEDLSDQSITSWASSLSLLTANPIELSSNSALIATTLALNIINAASSKGLSYDQVARLVDVADAVISVPDPVLLVGKRRRLLLSLSTVRFDSIVVDSYGTFATQTMAVGQKSIEFVKSNFRLSIHLLSIVPGENVSVSTPLSGLEQLHNVMPSIIRYRSKIGGTLNMTLRQTNGRQTNLIKYFLFFLF